MINKCGSKLKTCESNCILEDTTMNDCGCHQKTMKNTCGCNDSMMSPCNKPMMNNCNKPIMNACNNVSINTCDSIVEKTCSCEDEIIYIDVEKNNCFQNPCSTYVSPMYNMAPMQCMGNFTNKYPSLDDNMMSP